VIDSGELAIDTIGVKEAVINTTLQPGWYAVVSVLSATATLKAVTAQASILSKTGFASIPGAVLTNLRGTFTYAALPATAPATAGTGGNNPHPLIALRVV
jgi:ActR/RegA family two-component response regulator